MKSQSASTIGGVGPAVHDINVLVAEGQRVVGSKCDCRIEDTLGGGVSNSLRQASRLGVPVHGIFLVGDDIERPAVEALLRCEFPAAVCIPCLSATRRSVIKDGHVDTVRSETTRLLSAEHLSAIADAALTVVGPMAAADQPFVRQVLDAVPRAILQLSAQQVQDAAAATDLAISAWLTVVNQAELQAWTGLADPIASVQRLREQGVANILVTGPRGVSGFVDGNWLAMPAFEPVRVVRTVTAGDVFLGTLAAAMASGESWKHAVRLGLAAAVLHVEGNPACSDRQALEAVLCSRSPFPPDPRHGHFFAALRRHAAGLATASLLVAIGLGLALWL